MSLIIPPANNYQSPIVALPSRLLRDPATLDGPRGVSLEFDWTAMGKASGVAPNLQTAISVNLSNNANLRFSQIVSLKVDNSQCGADVLFVFTDTQETVLIPAFSPLAVVPVFTDQTQFYAIALGVVTTNDLTRCQVLNFVPPPATVPPSTEQNIPTFNAVFFNSGTTNIIPAGQNGTLIGLTLSGSASSPATPAAGTLSIGIQDGNAVQLLNTISVQVANNASLPYTTFFQDTSLNWRFSNGLKVVLAQTNISSGVLNVVAKYRTP